MALDILREAARRIARGERVALATIVGTLGSTPQRPGARALVSSDGSALGTLGGGAVEAEALREARLQLAGGPAVLREYPLSAIDEWGLACGGTMVVFVEPLDSSALGWLGSVAAAVDAGQSVGLVTLVEGPSPGRRLLVREGETAGTFGDPAFDREAAALGRSVMEREGTELAPLAGVRLYAEALGPPSALVIVGAGHVGKALATLGKFLGLRVVVVDDRPEYASPMRFAEADEVIAAPVADAVAQLRVTPRTAIVVAMRNHQLDYLATAAALRTEARYVGLVGSRRKASQIAERLVAEGIPEARVRALRSPIGLDIGARAPEEIALAILGERIMLRQGERTTPRAPATGTPSG